MMLGVLTFWISMPLVPAILLFKLLPDNKINISGPLAGPLGNFKLNASGAIAAYFAVLIALAFFIVQIHKDNKESTSNPRHHWRISGKIQLLDVNNKPMGFETVAGKQIKVAIEPDPWRIDAVAELDIKLVIVDEEPVITINIDKFGTGRIKIKKNSPDLEFKEGNIIHIKQPLQVHQDTANLRVQRETESRD
jgi:hypothetical protein